MRVCGVSLVIQYLALDGEGRGILSCRECGPGREGYGSLLVSLHIKGVVPAGRFAVSKNWLAISQLEGFVRCQNIIIYRK